MFNVQKNRKSKGKNTRNETAHNLCNIRFDRNTKFETHTHTVRIRSPVKGNDQTKPVMLQINYKNKKFVFFQDTYTKIALI